MHDSQAVYRVRLTAKLELDVLADSDADAIHEALAQAMTDPEFEVESVELIGVEEVGEWPIR